MKYLTALAFSLFALSSARGVTLINLDFSGPMSDIQQQTFRDAAEFWNSAITGYELLYNSQGAATPHALKITAALPYIDGPSGILGRAGPDTVTYYDNNPVGTPTMALYYTTTGSMEFDSADADELVANNMFYSVVLHEMGHILGIGTLWQFNNNVEGTNYPLYTAGTGQYTGANALSAWQSEFSMPSSTYVPVELGGGPSTADGHWNENDGGGGLTGFVSNLTGTDFASELMTGWSSSKFFLSTVTLGGLADLGYQVDYSKAGVIDHFVTVPEISSTLLALATLPWVLRRRRRAGA